MENYVKLENVTKVYKMGEVEIRAADGIDFSISKGEFVVIVGPSGAGKTTVLNILGGMDTATEGKVLVDGKDVAKYTPKMLTGYRRDDIGFVFQFYNLMQNLTALENVELAMQICKHPLDASEVLAEVGLEERMNNFPAQLSGGEQQRVSIARALYGRPQLMIFDEATSALDGATEQAIQKTIERLREYMTIVVIAHRLTTVEKCDRIYWILNGNVYKEGTSIFILEEYKNRRTK